MEKIWEVTIMELKNKVRKYKVTRRMPLMEVAETIIFDSLDDAKRQFELWLN